ncbi:MAG: hypothetical protein PHD15_02345 [Clostridia bacterium]|nr:hypothetical protein [Clostridia bacterium]MDD4386587.1 hypothetical protein [Clostridia bacterium]
MGAWGVKIYQDDVALDVKEKYIDLLKRGKSNKSATDKIIKENEDIIKDEEDAPVFWFSLANIQWDYGILLPQVKEKAIEYIKSETNLEKWKEEVTEKDYIKRKKVLEELESKLNSNMPEEKKITPYKIYTCPWNIGDIFAYKIKGDLYKNHYIVFVKVGNDKYAPASTCPLVYVYNKIFNNILTIEELKNIQYLPQAYRPSAYKDQYKDLLYKCLIGIEFKDKKLLDNLVYLGNNTEINMPDNEICNIYDMGNRSLCFLKKFEEEQIKSYDAWKGIDY